MSYDPKVPTTLKEMQTWFGAVICQKMTADFEIQPLGNELHQYIVSTSELPASERMQLYNQSYWFRLIDALHEEFPTIVRLFGDDEFTTQFAIPYLDAAPPRHWSLNLLADRFVEWVEAQYTKTDKQLVVICSMLDWACQELFLAKRSPPINVAQYSGTNAQNLLTVHLSLASTVRLFALPGHFMLFRKELLKHPAEYWQENDFPKLLKDKTYYFVVYRCPTLTVEWEELCKEEFLFLDLIAKHGTMDAALEVIQDMDDIDMDVIEQNLSQWVAQWLSYGWLTVLR